MKKNDQYLRTELEAERGRCLREESYCLTSGFYHIAKQWRANADEAQAALDALAPKLTGAEAGRGVDADSIDRAIVKALDGIGINALIDDYVYSPDEGSDHELTEFQKIILEDFWCGNLFEAVHMAMRPVLAATPTPPVSPTPDSKTKLRVTYKELVEAADDMLNSLPAHWHDDATVRLMDARDDAREAIQAAEQDDLYALDEPTPDSTSEARENWNAFRKEQAVRHLYSGTTPDSTGPAGAESEDAYIARVLAMSSDEIRAEAEAVGIEVPEPRLLPASLRNLRFRLESALANRLEEGDREAIAWLNDGVITIGAALAALTPSAPIAAPVRDDGARERIVALLRDDVEGEAVVQDLADAILASLPTPASDVPGEAQTEAARKERARKRIQALGAALSRRDWNDTERAYEAIRDAHDRPEIYDAPLTVSPGEAQTQEGGR